MGVLLRFVGAFAVTACLMFAGCAVPSAHDSPLEPPHQASVPYKVGPGATQGHCQALLNETQAPAVVVLVGHGSELRINFPNGTSLSRPLDAQRCAAVELGEVGRYQFWGYYGCTQPAVVNWNGSREVIEAFSPRDDSVCV